VQSQQQQPWREWMKLRLAGYGVNLLLFSFLSLPPFLPPSTKQGKHEIAAQKEREHLSVKKVNIELF
jgi:hypothetical protein